ncbi:MAG: hypothetical protein R3D71_00995 [Rickettsiales bacterium]
MNRKFIITTAIGFSLMISSNAYALKVYSPYVEKGVFEIESENRFDFDSRSSEDRFRQHKFGVGYGVADFWAVELVGELEKSGGRGYEYEATEIENIFQLTEVGEYWADFGLKVDYEFKHPSGDADKTYVALLAAKNFDQFTTMLNLGVEREIGSNGNKNPEGDIKWMAKYNYHRLFEPGVEYYGEIGEFTNMGSYSEQKHRLGPVFYGTISSGLKYEIGTLFGISKSAEDYAVKINLEYEFPL